MIAPLILLVLQLNSIVQLQAQDANPPNCKHHRSGMNKEMRAAVTDAHNTLRHLLAIGNITRHSFTKEKFPTAANMRFMKYGCKFENRAARHDLCKKIPHRTTFNYTNLNYGYVGYRRSRSALDALLIVVHEWWDRHLYNQGFKGLVPRPNDFPTLPFFMMANAETWKLGCAVKLCPDNDAKPQTHFYAVLCTYGKPHVQVGKPLYKKGSPCSQCGYGFECAIEKKLCKKIRRGK